MRSRWRFPLSCSSPAGWHATSQKRARSCSMRSIRVRQPNASRGWSRRSAARGSDRRTCASSGAGAGDRAGTVAHERRGTAGRLPRARAGGRRARRRPHARGGCDRLQCRPDGARGDRAACRGRRAARLRACATQPPPRTRWTRSSAATCWAKPVMRRRPFISRSADRSPVRAQATASLHVTGVSRRSGFGRADTSRTQSRV